MTLTIEEVSVRAKVNPSTIRYYERRGVLPLPQQSKERSREYNDVDIKRVKFVRFGRLLGMELDEIRALIEMIGEGNSEEIDVFAHAISQRASQLELFHAALLEVSAAIRAGETDESGAFGLLVEDREAASVLLPNDQAASEPVKGEGSTGAALLAQPAKRTRAKS